MRAPTPSTMDPSGRGGNPTADPPAGGIKGELSASIDLTQPADLNLVYRAVVNGWDVPQAIRQQIAAQLQAALDAAQATPTPARRTRRVLKLCKLLMLMEARNLIAEGHGKARFPYLRRRSPEQRKPRRRRLERHPAESVLNAERAREIEQVLE